MKIWIKKLIREAIVEERDIPRANVANRRPTSSDINHNQGDTWREHSSNDVYVLVNKTAEWVKDKILSKEAKDAFEKPLAPRNSLCNTLKVAKDPCPK